MNPQEQSITNTNQPQNVLQTSSPKIEEVEEKKKRFYSKVKKIIFSIVAIILLIIVTTIGSYLYIKTKKNFDIVTNPPVNSTTQNNNNNNNGNNKPPEENNYEEYTNESFKISFQYSKKDKFKISESENDDFQFQVSNSENQPSENFNGDNMIKGYFINIKPFIVSLRTMDEIIRVKYDYLKSHCPTSAEFTAIYAVTISNIGGKQFSVLNCNSDYIVSYIQGKSFVYEINQVYKGDVGFKQIYKLDTKKLVDSIKILENEDVVVLDPIVIFDRNKDYFTFEYPRYLDTTCCTLVPPPTNYDTLITLSANSDSSKTFGIVKMKSQNSSLEEFVTNQKKLLEDDYKIIKGRAPNGSEEVMEIDGVKAIKLSNYSWKGNELIYFGVKNEIYAISVINFPNQVYTDILNSFKLNLPKQ